MTAATRRRLYVRRWLGVDIRELPASAAAELMTEAQAARQLEVEVLAEAWRLALGGGRG